MTTKKSLKDLSKSHQIKSDLAGSSSGIPSAPSSYSVLATQPSTPVKAAPIRSVDLIKAKYPIQLAPKPYQAPSTISTRRPLSPSYPRKAEHLKQSEFMTLYYQKLLIHIKIRTMF